MAERKRKEKETKTGPWPLILRIVSGTLLFFLGVVYAVRTDAFYAVTIWPALVWCLPGLALLIPGIKAQRKRPYRWLVMSWIVFAVVYSEERIGILHVFTAAAVKPNLTVVTLNCAGGNPLAAGEVAAYRPDVVLLQESPSSMEIEDLTKKLYGKEGACLPGRDASILVHGTIEPIPIPRTATDFVAARVTLWNGRKLVVVSLRLAPPVFNLEYWTSDCWREYAQSRALHRTELADIARYLDVRLKDEPVILGGDCNTPPDPGIFECLQPRLRDVYPESGTFWGYTAVNDFPLARIDQIWVSRHFKALDTTAFKTEHSDHRLVRVKLHFAPD